MAANILYDDDADLFKAQDGTFATEWIGEDEDGLQNPDLFLLEGPFPMASPENAH